MARCELAGDSSLEEPYKLLLIPGGPVFDMAGRSQRFRFTIRQLMMAVVVSAVILVCAIEVHRIRRTQAFFRQQAAKYAQCEKNANKMRAMWLRSALFDKQLADSMKQSLVREERPDHFLARGTSQWHDRISELKIKSYASSLDSEELNLARAEAARIDEERFRGIKEKYQEAASRFWLPFTPKPLGSRRPEDDSIAQEEEAARRFWLPLTPNPSGSRRPEDDSIGQEKMKRAGAPKQPRHRETPPSRPVPPSRPPGPILTAVDL